MDDSKIIELYFDRNENAINETRNKYGNYFFAIANAILHNRQDSEETINDTYLAAWNSIPPHHPENLKTFIGKICRRLSINRYRAENAQKRGGGQVQLSFDELEECIGDEHSFKEALEEKMLAEMIDEFLLSVKESERKVFVCRYYYFDSIEEIAKRFGFTAGKTKMMLKRTRDKLKDYLLKEGVLL